VKYFFGRLFERKVDIRELKGIKICAIGSKTAGEVEKYGLRVDLVPEEFRAEGLIEAFLKEGSRFEVQSSADVERGTWNIERLKGLRLLLPRAEKAREIFPEKVRELGGTIDVPAAYRGVKPGLHGKALKRFLKEGRITVATFTSAATFNNFREIMGDDADALLRNVTIAVIGPVTAKAVEKAGLKVDLMPAEATVQAMVEEIKKWALR
jgi:uroporphyrinogen III methyltransferase/synthase